MKNPRKIESPLAVAERRIAAYRKSPVLGKVVAAVEQCLSEGALSVEKVADALSMTRGHLFRLVCERTGRSPLSLLNDLRFSRAARLLGNKALSVTQVAYMSGYSDLAHFSIAFKRFSGMSPKEYRAGR